jgi:hypothetical protein
MICYKFTCFYDIVVMIKPFAFHPAVQAAMFSRLCSLFHVGPTGNLLWKNIDTIVKGRSMIYHKI